MKNQTFEVMCAKVLKDGFRALLDGETDHFRQIVHIYVNILCHVLLLG
jgi:hypothetical protein